MPPSRSRRTLLVPVLLLLGSCATPPERSADGIATDAMTPAGDPPVAAADAFTPGVTVTPTEPLPKRVEVNEEVPDHQTAAAVESTPAVQAPRDLLGRIAARHALPDKEHPQALRERTWLIDRPAYLGRVIERARPYLHLIVEEVEARGMPGEIALLPVVESAFQPFAYSHGRAAGLWQFIPSTGRLYGLKQNWWYDGRRDVKAATGAALDYLEKLNRDFNGDWLLALAAYNAGEGTVMAAVKRNQKAGLPIDFWSLKLPRETTAYVPKLLAVSAVFARPQAFGLTLSTVDDTPVLAEVDTGGQIDLARAADLAGISVDELYRLNPGFNRWATDPEGPHTLLVPREVEATFRSALASLDPDGRLQWQRHQIRSGESLNAIANRYRTTPAVLRQVNQIDGNLIRAGHHLLIPVASKPTTAYTLSASQRQASGAATPPKAGTRKVVHIVRGGESLWDIGRRYGVSSGSLARWNGMAPRDTLAVGRQLAVWLPAQASGKTPPRAATLQSIRYTVRPGDSLSSISARFNVRVGDLRRWNDLGNSDLLHPGQKLTLHVDVTRQASAG